MADGVLHGVRILMVTHDYAPDLMGIAPYATETAEWLAAQGAEIDVLTMPPHYPDWKVPAGSPRGYTSENRNGVNVRRLPTYVPRNPSLLRRLAFEGSWTAAATPLRIQRIGTESRRRHRRLPGNLCSPLCAQHLREPPPTDPDRPGLGRAGSTAVWNGRRISGCRRARADGGTLSERRLRRDGPGHGFIEPLVRLGVDPDRIRVVANWSRLPVTGESEPSRDVSKFVVMHAGNMGLKQGLDELAPIVSDLETSMPAVQFEFLGGGSQARRTAQSDGRPHQCPPTFPRARS